MKINEIYESIQGEGPDQGFPTTIIRTQGCNLRCSWCDSKYTWTDGGPNISIPNIMLKVQAFGHHKVLITGGEPLLQPDINDLCLALINYDVCMETSGSICTSFIPNNVRVILDIKCPSSKYHQHMLLSNLGELNDNDVVKFVIDDRTDYEYAKTFCDQHSLTAVFSPTSNPHDLADWMLKDKSRHRLQLQLHRIIWPEQTKGV